MDMFILLLQKSSFYFVSCDNSTTYAASVVECMCVGGGGDILGSLATPWC
jgi:hypothetical protein